MSWWRWWSWRERLRWSPGSSQTAWAFGSGWRRPGTASMNRRHRSRGRRRKQRRWPRTTRPSSVPRWWRTSPSPLRRRRLLPMSRLPSPPPHRPPRSRAPSLRRRRLLPMSRLPNPPPRRPPRSRPRPWLPGVHRTTRRSSSCRTWAGPQAMRRHLHSLRRSLRHRLLHRHRRARPSRRRSPARRKPRPPGHRHLHCHRLNLLRRPRGIRRLHLRHSPRRIRRLRHPRDRTTPGNSALPAPLRSWTRDGLRRGICLIRIRTALPWSSASPGSRPRRNPGPRKPESGARRRRAAVPRAFP